MRPRERNSFDMSVKGADADLDSAREEGPMMSGATPRSIDRRSLLRGAAASIALLAAGCTALPPTTRRLLRIGAFTKETLETDGAPPEAERDVMDGLRAEGFIDGQTMSITWRHSNGKDELFAEYAAEFVDAGVDILIASTTGAVQAAMEATRTIPIVMLGAADAREYGVVDDYAHPGGNVTGTAFDNTGEAVKRLEVFSEAFPAIRRVVVLGLKSSTLTPRAARMRAAADALGVQLVIPMLDDDDALTRALESIGSDGLVTGSTIFGGTDRAIAFAVERRIPAVFSRPENVRKGALMSYGANRREFRLSIGRFVKKIAQGIPPGDIPVEEPTVFETYVNRRTASAAGLTIPDSILRRATVIE